MPPRRISRTITFSLPPEMFEEVQRVKEEEGRDMSELVREALRLYMEERELRRQERLERLRSRRGGQDQAQIKHKEKTAMSNRNDATPAALYARVSSDRQDVDLSVAAQLRALSTTAAVGLLRRGSALITAASSYGQRLLR